MAKIRTYFSLFVLLILLLSNTGKVLHELNHLSENYCEITELHFCQAEHNCPFCDFLVSSKFNCSDLDPEEKKTSFTPASVTNYQLISNTTVAPKFIFSLRGPPCC
jgi:hypothetical protein